MERKTACIDLRKLSEIFLKRCSTTISVIDNSISLIVGGCSQRTQSGISSELSYEHFGLIFSFIFVKGEDLKINKIISYLIFAWSVHMLQLFRARTKAFLVGFYYHIWNALSLEFIEISQFLLDGLRELGM